MYLFLDTETTGITRKPAFATPDLKSHPRLVQIAWLLTDEHGSELRAQNFIIRPDGFQIPRTAADRHRITTETARRLGIDLADALSAFSKDLAAANYLVAHNILYDTRVIAAEFGRIGASPTPLELTTSYCTMLSATRICGIAGGPRRHKWPTLTELHTFLFGQEFDGAHNAVADVRACAKCFFELKRRGLGFDGTVKAQALFDELYAYARRCPWFDTDRFVDDVYAQFEARGFITDKQRSALIGVRDMLETKSRPGARRKGRPSEPNDNIDFRAIIPASLRAMLADLFHQWRF
jgi:DNA polymerase III subunit epsilon